MTNMETLRLLVVEDIPDTREQLGMLLSDIFPDAEIDPAGSVDEATAFIDQRLRKREEYDLAVLDFKLPERPGTNPEIDESVCIKVLSTMPETTIVHVTGFARDPIAQQHMNTYPPPGRGRSLCLDKGDVRFAKKLRDFVKQAVFGARIERQMRDLFGARATETERLNRTKNLRGGSLTGRIADLCYDIRDHWNELHPVTKSAVLTQFNVDESVEPVRVAVR